MHDKNVYTHRIESPIMTKYIFRSALALVVANLAVSAHAATSGSQKFKVVVPTNIAITAPSDTTITHDETDNNQSFPAQGWIVKGNSSAGVSVSFATTAPFIHTTIPTSKRDASLALGFDSTTAQGTATWQVTKPNDVTDYSADDSVATVQAESSGVGRVTFNLTVGFVTDTFGTFPAGDYETTVTGTVTAK